MNPSIPIDDGSKYIKFNYIIKGNDTTSEHGPRLKVDKKVGGKDKLITFPVERDGSIEIKRKLTGNGSYSNSFINKLAILAGGFAEFAVNDIYEAYYSDNYAKERMDKIVNKFNALPKNKKEEYFKKAKYKIKRID